MGGMRYLYDLDDNIMGRCAPLYLCILVTMLNRERIHLVIVVCCVGIYRHT